MLRTAPLCLLLALCLTSAASAQAFGHDTGRVRLQVFNTGSIGARAGVGNGFELNRRNGLFDGQLFVGTSADRLSGTPYSGADWAPGTPVAVSEVSSGFLALRASFSDQNAPSPLGVTVSQRTLSVTTPPYDQAVLVEYAIRNTTSAPLVDIYAGLFADFDVAEGQDLGGFDPARNLAYTYTANPALYYGAVLVGDTRFAGWSVDLATGGVTEARVFEGMTTYGQMPAAAGDRVSVLGAGPYTIAPGDSALVRYAFVAATSLASLQTVATAARAEFAGAVPPTSRVQASGTAALRVFDSGYYGAVRGEPADTSFTFDGLSPLFEGQLIVAASPTQVSGAPYSTAPVNGVPGKSDWSDGTGPNAVQAPAPFTRALESVFTDFGPNNADPLGLTVRQRTLTRPGDAFVIVEMDLTSATARSGVYVGMFADYDVTPTTGVDLGGYDAATRTAYSFSPAGGSYYGVSVLSPAASGWSISTSTSAAGLYTALTTPGMTPTAAADRRALVGAGPFTFAAGVPQRVRFAYVGGTSLSDLVANATAARGLFATADGDAADLAPALRLTVAPNPATTQAAFTVTLSAAQSVRLSVVDVLGREVAVIADGARAAGTSTERLDTAALPPGIYVARLAADGRTVTRRFTVTH